MKISKEISIMINGASFDGILSIPEGAQAIILFAHGSGSSRLSPRNASVAAALQRAGIATLLMDLLTEQEDADSANRFDIELLTSRLEGAIEWLWQGTETSDLKVGLFGASTGAAAALFAAARYGKQIYAVVSRGGRPDLASKILGIVMSPTLLIVGGADTEVLQLNQVAFDKLTCEKQIHIVLGATHLFEEAGALEEVSKVAAQWFVRHLEQPIP